MAGVEGAECGAGQPGCQSQVPHSCCWSRAPSRAVASTIPDLQMTRRQSPRISIRESDTLARIPDLGRRLLALRSYLRAGSTLPARWSWSEQEIRDFEQSQEFCDAQAEVDRVVAAFAAAFPGYTLYVNREVRSLDVQIERWNSNASVDAASRTLLDDLRRASAQRAPGKGADWLQDSLTSWTLAVPVTLAAPGLSAHGQSRAFDFQVERDGTIVAGTEAGRRPRLGCCRMDRTSEANRRALEHAPARAARDTTRTLALLL